MQARSGRVYRPMDTYAVGDRVVFSELSMAEGRVVSVRAGQNPKYTAFSVVEVSFAGGPNRAFASSLDILHPLNRPVEELIASGDEAFSEIRAAAEFAKYVAPRLERRLQNLGEWVQLNGSWFLHGLLPEVHVGHLNLAEAVIYEARRPVPAREMLAHIDGGGSAATDALLFALNHALAADERFDNVSTGDERVWYLRSLEPEAVFSQPPALKVAFAAGAEDYVGLTMLDLIEDIGDELDLVEGAVLRDLHGLRFEVNFPHLTSGTMPAPAHFVRSMGDAARRHYAVTLVDGRSGKRFEVWVVPDMGYACGLGDWYASVGMTVGGQVTVTPADQPMVYTLTVTPVRGGRSDWVRTASIVEGRLTVQMMRASTSLRCDPNLLVSVPDRAAIAQVMARSEAANTPLPVIIRGAFQELAKLSSQGLAHAKSIYSIVNMQRRAGAAAVFATLTRQACYDPVGDGQWAFDANLVGRTYETPEEMMERPLSSRVIRTRDQVTRFLGR